VESSAVVLAAARARGPCDRPSAKPAATDASSLMDRSSGTVPASFAPSPPEPRSPASDRTSRAAPAKVRVDLTTKRGLLAAYKSGYFGSDDREATEKLMAEALKRGFLTAAVDLTTDLGLLAAYISGYFGPEGREATGKMLVEALKCGFVTPAEVTRWYAAHGQETVAPRAKAPDQTLILQPDSPRSSGARRRPGS
jgi:hypothetical protein